MKVSKFQEDSDKMQMNYRRWYPYKYNAYDISFLRQSYGWPGNL